MDMAKGKVRNLDKAIDKLFKDYETALTKAMTYASEKAKDDIEFKAKSCLWEYYDNYEPNVYERTGTLEDAFVPYMNVKRVGEGIEASVGMGYDASRLDGVYSGSQKWTPVDGSWVLQNYLLGIHPATNGAFTPGSVEYFEYWDVDVGDRPPIAKMEEYLNNYVRTFNDNVLVSFAKQLTRR